MLLYSFAVTLPPTNTLFYDVIILHIQSVVWFWRAFAMQHLTGRNLSVHFVISHICTFPGTVYVDLIWDLEYSWTLCPMSTTVSVKTNHELDLTLPLANKGLCCSCIFHVFCTGSYRLEVVFFWSSSSSGLAVLYGQKPCLFGVRSGRWTKQCSKLTGTLWKSWWGRRRPECDLCPNITTQVGFTDW